MVFGPSRLTAMAREAALILHGHHMARLDSAPTEWVVRGDAAPYTAYLERTR